MGDREGEVVAGGGGDGKTTIHKDTVWSCHIFISHICH